MNKFGQKILKLTLALCIITSSLAGCGNVGENSVKKSDAYSKESETAVSSTVAAHTEDAKEETDPFAEKVTLEVLVYHRTGEGDWNEYPFVKQVEELYNVDLQIEMISQEIWNEKIPLRFASKDLPDFIICNASKSVDAALYGSQGFLADLTEYISEENTPNILKMFNEVESSKAYITSEDGAIYSMIGVDNEGVEVDGCRFYINEKWAMQVLGKLPENTDEFYEYLKGVKKQDVDGDGDPNNEIPLGGYYSMSTGINTMTMLRSAFGLLDKRWQVMEDGQVIYTRSSENYKEFLKYVNKLYEEELLDQEFFTQTADQYKAKHSQYLYGAFGDWGAHNSKPAEDTAAGVYKMYVGMPAMTSSVNDIKVWPKTDMKVSGQITVMKDCENIERVMAIIDWFLSEEGFLAVAGGPQYGEHEEYPEYGVTGGAQDYVFADKNGDEQAFPEEFDSRGDFLYGKMRPNLSSVPFYRNWVQIKQEGSTGEWLTLTTAGTHAEYFKPAYPAGAVMTQDESDEMSLLQVDIDSFTDEMESKMILGEVDIDEVWDTYLEGLEQRGIEAARQIKQDAYDRYVEIN